MSSTCVCVHVSVCYWQVCCNSFLHIHPHVQRYINNGTEHCALFYCTSGPCSVAYSALFHLCLNFPFTHFYGDFIRGCNIDFNKIKQCSQSQQFLRAVLALSKGTKGDVCTLDWLTCRFVSVEYWKPFTVQTVFGFISASLLYYLHSSGWLTHCCLWGWTSTDFMSLLNNLRKGMFYLVLLHACAVLLNETNGIGKQLTVSAAVLRFVQMWGQKKMWGGLWKNESLSTVHLQKFVQMHCAQRSRLSRLCKLWWHYNEPQRRTSVTCVAQPVPELQLNIRRYCTVYDEPGKRRKQMEHRIWHRTFCTAPPHTPLHFYIISRQHTLLVKLHQPGCV